MNRWITSSLLALALLAAPAGASAKSLTIGMSTEAVMDPHFTWSFPAIQYYQNYHALLTRIDRNGRPYPQAAESYEVSNGVWRFKLRKGLKFDNGMPFTAEDVIASFERAKTLPNALASFAGIFAGIAEMRAPDPLTVEIVTDRPYPTLPVALAQISIIPASIAKTATKEDFISGKAAVGMGPFSFSQYVPGDRLVLKRNDNYYGQKPEWDTVTFRFIVDPAARQVALRSGEVDMINDLPPYDMKAIQQSGFNVFSAPSDRVLTFLLDSERTVSPFVKGPNGETLTSNPLQDVRVREAMSIAIDRTAIRDHVLQGLSYPNGQYIPEGFGGYNPAIPVPRYDSKRAAALLAEAGWPDGFSIAFHCLDEVQRECQAASQMLSRVKIKVDLRVLPRPVYWPIVTKHDGERASMLIMSWGASSSGEANVLETMIHSYDKDKKLGTWNLAHYSNPALDALIEKSMTIEDSKERHARQAEAMAIATKDVAGIAIHTNPVIAAARKGLEYTHYPSRFIIAEDVKTKP